MSHRIRPLIRYESDFESGSVGWTDHGAVMCNCGHEHDLERGDSCCDHCGQEYNTFGQELANQLCWEE